MRLNVNPNRMELSKLKKRIATAKRGHKLLKDKQDELMRRFIDLVRHNNKLRMAVEKELVEAYRDFVLVGAICSPDFLEEAVMMPREQISIELSSENIMSVIVPKMQFIRSMQDDEASIFPYGFYNTSDELDRAIKRLYNILPKLLELGEIEKTCSLLTDEIEKTRRRVNALEYMTIPQLEETIKYIKMKLDENERGNLLRLIKVKDMMMKEQTEQVQA